MGVVSAGNDGCSTEIGMGFECFSNNEARFQEDAYPAPKKRMAQPPKAFLNKKESRQAKKIRETKARGDLDMGEKNNPRGYKKKAKAGGNKGHFHGSGKKPKHAGMKKKWKDSSSVSGDKRGTKRRNNKSEL